MVKVVWLFPPSEKGGFPNISQYRFYKRMPIRASIIYPYLASVGITLLNQSHDVVYLDCPTMNIAWDEVYWQLEDADYVILEGRTPTINYTWGICGEIKYKFPNIKIILYGDHVTWNPNESLPYCDFIVKGGNYDVGIFNLIRSLEYGGAVSSFGKFNSNETDLNDLPFTDRQLVPWNLYYESWRHREKFFWIMSMRGCYYKCIFCAWAKTFWNNTINYRTIYNVADEYQELYLKYGECEVLDDADMFDTSWGKDFAEEMIKRYMTDEQVLWAMQTHPNMINNLENMNIMRKSGLRTVKLGIESLNDKSLHLMKKGTNLKQIKKSITILKDADIMVHANLIVGFPWESKEDAYKSIEVIKDLNPNQAQFSLLIPYPNTELYDLAKSNDWLLVKEGDWESFDASKPMLKMEGLSSEEIIQLYKDHWSKFYLNWRYIWNHVKKVHHWEGVMQLFRGFKSIYFGHMRAIDD